MTKKNQKSKTGAKKSKATARPSAKPAAKRNVNPAVAGAADLVGLSAYFAAVAEPLAIYRQRQNGMPKRIGSMSAGDVKKEGGILHAATSMTKTQIAQGDATAGDVLHVVCDPSMTDALDGGLKPAVVVASFLVAG